MWPGVIPFWIWVYKLEMHVFSKVLITHSVAKRWTPTSTHTLLLMHFVTWFRQYLIRPPHLRRLKSACEPQQERALTGCVQHLWGASCDMLNWIYKIYTLKTSIAVTHKVSTSHAWESLCYLGSAYIYKCALHANKQKEWSCTECKIPRKPNVHSTVMEKGGW